MECYCEVEGVTDPRCQSRGMCGKVMPANCPHCEYDRRFPGFEGGGWIQQDNNGPIVSCPMCNDDGSHAPRP